MSKSDFQGIDETGRMWTLLQERRQQFDQILMAVAGLRIDEAVSLLLLMASYQLCEARGGDGIPPTIPQNEHAVIREVTKAVVKKGPEYLEVLVMSALFSYQRVIHQLQADTN